MIPVSLSIQGIYSYQARQTIDFTKLTAAGIFGIFGSVGSGKSTILEAITYALYGRTDRLNLSGDNRNYNMMNLKSNELLIEFVFRTGPEQSEYMAIVRSRRNSKQFDDVKACDRTAYKKNHKEWVPIEVDTLETILGLSYDNFKRTVIIPQGKFQEFLLLGSKERTQMMKELFNLERYELYYKVVSLESKTNQQKQNIEGHLQQLGEITPEHITATEHSLIQLQKEIESKVSELNTMQASENQQRRIKELVYKVKNNQVKLHALKPQEQDILNLEKRLAAYENCIVSFNGFIGAYETSSSNINQLKTVILSDETYLSEISAQLKELETKFEVAREEFDCREALKQKAEEISKIARILDLQERYLQFQDRIAKGEKLVVESGQKIEVLKNRQEKLFAELKGLKEQNPDMSRLSKAKEWFTLNQILVSAGKDIELEISVLTKEMDDLGQQKALLFNSDCFSGISISEGYDRIITLFDEKKKVHQHAIEMLTSEKQHYQVQQKLEEYASELEDGKPCPLCGSAAHPKKFNSQNLHETLLNLGNEVLNHEEILISIEKGLKKFTEINTSLCLKEDILSKILQKYEENQQRQKTHKDLFIWEEFKDESDLTRMFEKADNINSQIANTEKEVEALRLQLEKESNQKELYTKAIGDLKINSNQELTVANTLKDQLTILDIKSYGASKPETLTHEKETLLKQYKAIEERYQQTLNQLNKLKKEQDTLHGKLDTNKKTHEKEHLALQTLSLKIEEQLKITAYNSLEEVKQVLAWSPDLERERKMVSVFRQELNFVEKQLVILRDELNGHDFNESTYSELLLTIEKLLAEINLKNQEKGHQEANLKKLKTDFEERVKLLKIFSSLESRLEDIKTLKQLFKGSGFVNYISSVYLQELIHSANERFYKLSGQKLSLEITADNNFEVRDFMNGGKLRNIKTLSGGQTFQAALSLALALSDNTRKLSGAGENFFFLDEGFGSLDKESLQVVFDTLKALRHENRIVGIISHVEDMNQEIDIHLRVKNHEESGSKIEKSWER